jgi:hypothetical protein
MLLAPSTLAADLNALALPLSSPQPSRPAQSTSAGKKASKATTPSRSSLEIFDPTVKQLPPNFKGCDFGTLFKSRSAAPKGEFETSDHYRERLKTISGDSFFAVALDLSVKYDADKQEFTTLIETEKLQSEAALVLDMHSSIQPVIVVKQTRAESGKYLGSNAFGVKARVTKVKLVEDAIVISHLCNDDIARNFNIPVSLDRAPSTKVAFLLVFKPEPIGDAGLTTTASGYSSPTVDYPYEVMTTDRYIFAGETTVWAYDKGTGEVLGKFKLGVARLPNYPGADSIIGEHWDELKRTMEQVLVAKDPIDKVLAFYQNQLQTLGFSVSVTKAIDSVATVTADSSDRKRRIQILLTGDGSETTISYGEKWDL